MDAYEKLREVFEQIKECHADLDLERLKQLNEECDRLLTTIERAQ